MNTENTLIWLDLEMTGLDPVTNVIIEIATVITDQNLCEVAVGPQLAIHQPSSELVKMDAWNTEHHTKSGLVERVKKSTVNTRQAEQQTLAFLRRHVAPGLSPMCGNSICTDRRFLIRHMPELEAFFHYRNLDVTSVKLLADMWAPQVSATLHKDSKHQALSDIRDSIAELQHYREHILAKPASGK